MNSKKHSSIIQNFLLAVPFACAINSQSVVAKPIIQNDVAQLVEAIEKGVVTSRILETPRCHDHSLDGQLTIETEMQIGQNDHLRFVTSVSVIPGTSESFARTSANDSGANSSADTTNYEDKIANALNARALAGFGEAYSQCTERNAPSDLVAQLRQETNGLHLQAS